MKYISCALLVTILIYAPNAVSADPTDLPALASVASALKLRPAVREAALQGNLADSNRQRLQAGPYELNVVMNAQRRRIGSPPDKYNEWDVGLERQLRLPGKARLDTEIGELGVAQAKLIYDQAIQSGARQLLKLWFSWARENTQSQEWQIQAELLREQLRITERRANKGDVARLDVGLAEAALAQADFSLQQARGRERLAANEITLQYPGIGLPDQLRLTTPEALARGLDYWRPLIQRNNADLNLAYSESKRLSLVSKRAVSDATPDPTLGMRYGSERSGEERIVGIGITIPIPIGTRSAAISAAQAEIQMAAQREAIVLQRGELDLANIFTQAQTALTSWQSMRSAAENIQRNADLMQRAYSLGERGLFDVLAARRQLIETRLTTTIAQIDAIEARYRLLFEAGELWPLAD